MIKPKHRNLSNIFLVATSFHQDCFFNREKTIDSKTAALNLGITTSYKTQPTLLYQGVLVSQHLFHRRIVPEIDRNHTTMFSNQPSKSGFSRYFKPFTRQLETKVAEVDDWLFDLLASNPRILPLACAIEHQHLREDDGGEVDVPPGGARLVTFHCQRFGCHSHNRRWSDSRGRIDIGHRYCCTAKHP